MCDCWKDLVTEQIAHLRESGLYDRIERLYCGAIIDNKDLNELKEIGGPKLELLYVSQDRTIFEFLTLNKLHVFCKNNPDTFGFYFHTKGVSWINQDQTVYKVGNSWRKMNEYFMFDKYKIAIYALRNKKYDLYGTNYQEIFNDQFRLLGGNFFWFRADYVEKLEDLSIRRDDRNLSEKWIASKTHNVYSPFDFSGNTRYDAVPSCLYIESLKSKRTYFATKLYFSRFKYFLCRLIPIKKMKLHNSQGQINIEK